MLNFDSSSSLAVDILENMDIGVLVYDATGTLLYSNQNARTLLACSEEAMPQWPDLDLTGSMVGADMRPLPPLELPLFLAMQTGQSTKATVIGIASGGQGMRIWVSMSAKTVFDVDGAIRRIVVTVVETTATKLAEDCTRMSDMRLASAMASMTDALLMVDTEGRFVEFNDAYIRLIRAPNRGACANSMAELSAMVDVTFLDGGAVPEAQWPIWRALRGESGSDLRYSTRRRDTGKSWVGSFNYAPIRDGLGTITGAVMVARDVTTEAEAARALQESEARFREFINAAPEGVFVQQDGRIMFANLAMAELLGRDHPAALVGDALLDWVAPEFKAVVVARMSRPSPQGGPTNRLEKAYLRRDGVQVPVETNSSVVHFDGKPASLVFVRDITGRRLAAAENAKLEQQMRQMQKLESIGRLAGGIAHGFNNILMVQKGYCELVQQQLRKQDPLKDIFGHIEACTDRAVSLTRQLLAFSRKQVIDPRVFDVNIVVEALGSMLRWLIGEDIDLTIETAQVPAMIESDPGQIEEVLVNLVVNARDAMPNGGKLAIEITLLDLTPDHADVGLELPPGRYIRLRVSDNGMGMDEATRNQVFEPFVTTKPAGTGTGLGLSTVHGLVNQAGGSIVVDSEPGQGASFRIYLPAAADEVKVESPAPGADRSVTLSGELVLVVEDDPTLRGLIKLMLENLGYDAMVAANGEEALRLIEVQGVRPEVILTDVVMPGMNGRELAERLRKTVPAMPIVFMSGYTYDIIAHRGVPEAGLEFIQKPFGISEIADKLTHVFARRA